MSDYVIWDENELENACHLTELNGFDEVYRLYDGDAVLNDFPQDVNYEIDHEGPEHPVMTDNAINNLDIVIISDKIKTFLADQQIDNVEFLPIQLVYPTGRRSSRPYFIFHPVGLVDCLDIDASGGKWDVLDEDIIETVEKLVLHEDKIDTTRACFRIKHFTDVLLIKRSLADELDKMNFSGLKFNEIADYVQP